LVTFQVGSVGGLLDTAATVDLRSDAHNLGGMFTLLKVREHLDSYDDPGFYKAPPGTVAELARPEDAKRDGIPL